MTQVSVGVLLQCSSRKYGSPMMCRIKSLGESPPSGFPVRTTRTVLGTVTGISPVRRAKVIAVDPTPKAKVLRTPDVGECESVRQQYLRERHIAQPQSDDTHPQDILFPGPCKRKPYFSHASTISCASFRAGLRREDFTLSGTVASLMSTK